MNRETISFVGSYEDMDRKILRYMDILELLNILSGTFAVRKKKCMARFARIRKIV